MEDAATAEISRAQVWQWVHHATGILDEGRIITYELFQTLLDEELDKLKAQFGDTQFANGHFQHAAKLFDGIIANDEFSPFLTSVAYHEID